MSVQIDLPVSLEEQVKTLAEREGISVDEFISIALAEKVATLETATYLSERAKRGSRERLLEILAKAPDIAPNTKDSI